MNIDDILASIDAQTEEYKKQARNITNKNKSVINQQYDTANAIAEMQAREQQKLAKDQLTGLLDANAVNEAVARRNTLESLQNMGLVKSGLNETSQTAISVMRGNADASARKSVSDAVMSLSNQLAALKAENESKRYGALAEQDIALAQSYQQAEANAANSKLSAQEKYQSSLDKQAEAALSADKATLDRIDKNSKWAEEQNIKYGTNYSVDSYGNITKDGKQVVDASGVVNDNGASKTASSYALFTLESINPLIITNSSQAVTDYAIAAQKDGVDSVTARENIKNAFVANGHVSNPALMTDREILWLITTSLVTAPNGSAERQSQIEEAAELCNYLDLRISTSTASVENLYPTIR